MKLLLIALTMVAPAQAEPVFVKHCPAQFIAEAEKRDSKEEWKEQAPGAAGEKVYRTPTDTMGRWLEVAYTDASTTLFDMSNASTTKVIFGKSCAPVTSKGPGFDARKQYGEPNALWLNDQALEELMKKHPQGLIYVWSPGMTYSVQFYKIFEEVAKELNLKFLPVRDHRSKFTELEGMAKHFKTPEPRLKLNSVELYMRHLTTHFPASVVFKNGRIHDDRIIGVMEKPELRDAIKQQLEAL